MPAHHPVARRSGCLAFAPAFFWTFGLLLAAGCQSPRDGAPVGTVAQPSLAAVPDVRSEANLVEMENQYIAEKNSQPTHQHEAEAKAAKKKAAQQKQAEEQAAKEAAAAQPPAK